MNQKLQAALAEMSDVTTVEHEGVEIVLRRPSGSAAVRFLTELATLSPDADDARANTVAVIEFVARWLPRLTDDATEEDAVDVVRVMGGFDGPLVSAILDMVADYMGTMPEAPGDPAAQVAEVPFSPPERPV